MIVLRNCIIGFLLFVASVASSDNSSNTSANNSKIKGLIRIYNSCQNSEDMVRCLKLQGLKLVTRAAKVQNLKFFDGLSIVMKPDFADQRSLNEPQLNNNDLENISSKSLDSLLMARLTKLMDSHQVQLNIPRLMTVGEQEGGRLIEEGRKKMKKYLGPFIAAVLLKAGILKMAYHSIAIVAGKALIIGKIALIISAIIGLKKLVSPEGEKTTYEIVKHPHVSQSHTYSASHGEYEGHESGGAYHRSLGEEEILMQDKAYRAHVPRQ